MNPIQYIIFLPIMLHHGTISTSPVNHPPTPTSTPAYVQTMTPTWTPTPMSTGTPDPTFTPTLTPTPTQTPTPMPTDTPTPTPTNTPTPPPTNTPTPVPTNTPLPTNTPTPTIAPTSGSLPTDCSNAPFANYALNCGAEASSTDPSPWMDMPGESAGSLRVNTYFPPHSGNADFAFGDSNLSSNAQSQGWVQCVNLASTGALGPGSNVSFAGYYRAQLSPYRLIGVRLVLVAFNDPTCSTSPQQFAISNTMDTFDHNWYSLAANGVIPSGAQSVGLEVYQDYSAGSGAPTSAFWDDFFFYVP